MKPIYQIQKLADRLFKVDSWSFYAGIIIYSIAFIITYQDPFFWDSIQLGAKHAWYFYQNPNQWVLPNSIDSGHVPGFGKYLALWWYLFSPSLWISHVALLPFQLLFLFYAFKLVSLIVPRPFHHWAFLLCICQPTIFAQFCQISPDVIVIASYTLVLYGLLTSNTWKVLMGGILLVIINNRGFIIMNGLLLMQVLILYLNGRINRGNIVKLVISFMPSIALFGLYQIYHHLQVGWVGFHNEMPWSASFASNSLLFMLRNSLVIAWRMIDFGMVIPVLIVTIGYLMNWWKLKTFTPQQKHFLMYTGGVALSLLVPALLFKGLLAHRYFMPIYFGIVVLFSVSVTGIKNRVLWYIVVLIGLVSGHFWVYPRTVAQGWDASLAYRDFLPLQKKMNDFIDKQGVDPESVASFFPLTAKRKDIFVNNSDSQYKEYLSDNQTKYLLDASICNDTPDQLLQSNRTEYDTLANFVNGSHYISLLQKKQ